MLSTLIADTYNAEENLNFRSFALSPLKHGTLLPLRQAIEQSCMLKIFLSPPGAGCSSELPLT